MMPRRNRRRRRKDHAILRRQLDPGPPRRMILHRDTCGKLLFPSYTVAERIAGQARARYRNDDDGHTIYRCRWNSGWHLSGRTAAEVDARRAYYHNREEAIR